MSLFVFFSCRVYVRVSIDSFSSLHPFLFSLRFHLLFKGKWGFAALLYLLLSACWLLGLFIGQPGGQVSKEWGLVNGWMDGWVKNWTGLDWTLGGIWDMGFLVGLFLFFQHCRFLRVGLACSLVCRYTLGVQETGHWLADWVGQVFLSTHVSVVIVAVGGCLSNSLGLPHLCFLESTKQAENGIKEMERRACRGQKRRDMSAEIRCCLGLV